MIPFPEVLLRLAIALLLGALIGLERESNEHAAGLRTNALVCLGCALFTIISAYGFNDLLRLNNIQVDPGRIASYIVAGIGFLGGGAIYLGRDRQKVRGLTTAAAIWVVAAIGMACGIGLLWEAVVVTFFSLLILMGLRITEPLILPKRATAHSLQVDVNPEAESQVLTNLYAICARNKVEIEHLTLTKEEKKEIIKASCKVVDRELMVKTLDELRSLESMLRVDIDLEGIEKTDI
jgi:putative Mg2+ transporter-C (MgtC) family protein